MSDENFSLNNNRVVHRDIEKEMRESFLAYSMSVIVSRALPDVRDGLSPFTDVSFTQCMKTDLLPIRSTESAPIP